MILPCEVCSRELEIGVVKYIECLCPELKAHPLRKVEIFKNRHVRSPECRPHKGVAPQIAHAAQARRCEEVFWQVENVSSMDVCSRSHSDGRWPRHQDCNPTLVDTIRRIESGCIASKMTSTPRTTGYLQPAQPAAWAEPELLISATHGGNLFSGQHSSLDLNPETVSVENWR